MILCFCRQKLCVWASHFRLRCHSMTSRSLQKSAAANCCHWEQNAFTRNHFLKQFMISLKFRLLSRLRGNVSLRFTCMNHDSYFKCSNNSTCRTHLCMQLLLVSCTSVYLIIKKCFIIVYVTFFHVSYGCHWFWHVRWTVNWSLTARLMTCYEIRVTE